MLRSGASAEASPAQLPPPPASTQPAPATDRSEPRVPPVERAPHPRARVQTRVASHKPNRTPSGLFPKFRIVDDFHKP
jgi:hypothetical protein